MTPHAPDGHKSNELARAKEIVAEFSAPGRMLSASNGAMQDYYEAKGFIEGWNLAVKASAEISDNQGRYSLPGMTSLEAANEITEEILKLLTEGTKS